MYYIKCHISVSQQTFFILYFLFNFPKQFIIIIFSFVNSILRI